MTEIKKQLPFPSIPSSDCDITITGRFATEINQRVEELEAEVKKLRGYIFDVPSALAEAVAAERERINVAVTKLMCKYGPDDPLWHTIDHVARVMEAAKEKTDDETHGT